MFGEIVDLIAELVQQSQIVRYGFILGVIALFMSVLSGFIEGLVYILAGMAILLITAGILQILFPGLIPLNPLIVVPV